MFPQVHKQVHEWCMDFFPSVAVFKSTQTSWKLGETNPWTIHAPVYAPGATNPCTYSCTWGKKSYTCLSTFSIEKSFFYSYTGSAELARLTRWPAGQTLGIGPAPRNSVVMVISVFVVLFCFEFVWSTTRSDVRDLQADLFRLV